MSVLFPNISAVVLAGGKNSRYNGKDKAFLKIEGEYFIDRILKVYNSLFDEIIIITNSADSYKDYSDYIINKDYYKDIGPLAGLHSAMKTASNHKFFALSCDTPFPNKKLIADIINSSENYDALIPIYNDKIEPLHAVYSTEKLELLENHIKNSKKRSIRSFLEKINTKYYKLNQEEVSQNSFLNINSQSDFEKYLIS
jgi:molybdopterin-guanine dinucleotide biosynthesis protein A